MNVIAFVVRALTAAKALGLAVPALPLGAWLGIAELACVGLSLVLQHGGPGRALVAITVILTACIGVRIGHYLEEHGIG